MIREIFVVQNITTNDVEIKDFGIILPSGQTYDLVDMNKATASDELYNLFLTNQLIRLINGVSVSLDNSYDINQNVYNLNIDLSKPLTYLSAYTFVNNLDIVNKLYIDNGLTGKSNTGHTHTTSDITNLSIYSGFTNYYTIPSVNSLIKVKTNLLATTVYTDQINTYGAFNQTFLNNTLNLRNPANTFSYTILTSAITANRTITLPLLTGNDTMVTAAYIQTLTNKTITLANNTLNDTGAVLGDLVKYNGTKFVRFPRGTTNQVLKSSATDLVWSGLSYSDISNLSSYSGFTNYYLKTNVDTLLSNYLPLTGGTISGKLTINGILNINSAITYNIKTLTGSTTLNNTYNIILCNSLVNINITLPISSTVNNILYRIKNINNGQVSIIPSGTDQIDNLNSFILKYKFDSIDIVSNGSGWYIL